jgi:hypothetical protein
VRPSGSTPEREAFVGAAVVGSSVGTAASSRAADSAPATSVGGGVGAVAAIVTMPTNPSATTAEMAREGHFMVSNSRSGRPLASFTRPMLSSTRSISHQRKSPPMVKSFSRPVFHLPR